jgi:hypothetical protein
VQDGDGFQLGEGTLHERSGLAVVHGQDRGTDGGGAHHAAVHSFRDVLGGIRSMGTEGLKAGHEDHGRRGHAIIIRHADCSLGLG